MSDCLPFLVPLQPLECKKSSVWPPCALILPLWKETPLIHFFPINCAHKWFHLASTDHWLVQYQVWGLWVWGSSTPFPFHGPQSEKNPKRKQNRWLHTWWSSKPSEKEEPLQPGKVYSKISIFTQDGNVTLKEKRQRFSCCMCTQVFYLGFQTLNSPTTTV